MAAVLKNGEPSPFVQLLQAKAELDATRPPALLPSPTCTFPARDRRLGSCRSRSHPPKPPACRLPTVRTSDVSARG